MKTARDRIRPYVTKDGSEIRELMHPAVHGPSHGSAGLSLAEALVPPGAATAGHVHHASEEVYHFLSGLGRMRLGDREFPVRPGDTVCIPPGEAHAVANPGPEPLVFLCCCAPAYSHDDTRLGQGGPA